MNKYIRLFYLLFGLVVIFQLVHTAILRSGTGILAISSTNTSATLTITKNNALKATLGVGSAHVRIAPGTYVVTATTGDEMATQKVTVTKKQTRTVSLAPKRSETQSSAPSLATQAMDNSLVKGLPFIGAGHAFNINYLFTGTNRDQLVVTITAPDTTGQQQAITWLEGLGYSPSKLDIQYYFGDPGND